MKVRACVPLPEDNGVLLQCEGGCLYLWGMEAGIMRCVFTTREAVCDASPLGLKPVGRVPLQITETAESYRISTGRVAATVCRDTGRMTWWEETTGRLLFREGPKELSDVPLMVYSTGGEPPVLRRVATVDGERNFIENLRPQVDHTVYRARLHFQWSMGEQLHGLGQGEEGIYDYRGQVQYLYQHNMRIPIPFLVSSRNYGVLVDCGSLMTFQDDCRGSYLYLDAVEQLDYYVIAGDNLDELIGGYRHLTGKAGLLPKWAYGYIQSKEAYHSQEELLEVAREYRRRGIGLDCVVQDWNTWEPGKWGNKRVDRNRYPDLQAMHREMKQMHVHTMVSVWPNMNENTEDYQEMQAQGLLLEDRATYDAFSEEGRALYWKQAERELFRGGFDSWWCDSTEPFSGPDWGGGVQREPWERFQLVGEEHRRFLRADRANLYALAHAKGIYENQRKAAPEQRVLNLTRSGYAGGQQYGTVLWSGDICATWETLRRQITEGLNMAMSGMPYWTLDIGGFFTVRENWQGRGCGCHTDPTPKWFWQGDYEQGVADLGYRELYVRWFQMGVFLPMFRSHGTDTPREVWQFGAPGEAFYEALTKAIGLRYRLMPYIYSMAWKVWAQDGTMMRSLLFDFPQDPVAAELDTQFLFGDSLLVCPITRSMYYTRNSQPLPDADHSWRCYLPAGTSWVDLETHRRYHGGQWITVPVTLDHIPVFVRAGAIVPMEQSLQYAGEVVDTPLELHIIPGADGTFALYEDEGDGYGYETGRCNVISMHWNDQERKLTIGPSNYRFPQGLWGRTCRVLVEGQEQLVTYTGAPLEIIFTSSGGTDHAL